MPATPPQKQRSMYERLREAECASLQNHYEGSLNALFCVISTAKVPDVERSALVASAQRGGFDAGDVIWVTTGTNNDQPVVSSETDVPAGPLSPSDLQRLIEVLDPLCLVVLDQQAAEVLSRAYNQPVKLECCDSILGRPCVAFVQFSRMLATDERKQRAWGLLKELLTQVNDL